MGSTVSLDDPENRQFLQQNPANRSKSNLQTGNQSSRGAKGAGSSAQPRRTSGVLVPAAMQLRAEGDVLALADNNEHGELTVRIFDMAPAASYPIHQMAMRGAKLRSVVYDVTMDQALIVCFSHRSGVTCERRHLQSLMEPEMESISWWVGVVVFFILFWFRHECFGETPTRSEFGSSSSANTSMRRLSPMIRRLPMENDLNDRLGLNSRLGSNGRTSMTD